MRRRGFAMAVGVQDPPALHRSETCFGKPVGPPPSAKTTDPHFASFGNLFREARRATPQRQNNGSEREEGCRRSFSRRPENCFGKPDGPAPSAKITERVRATAFATTVAEASAVARKVVSGSPTGQLPCSAKITAASASDAPPPRLSRKLRPSPRKFSREARRARPQRQNDGSFRAADGPDPSPNLRRVFASQKMARDAPGPGFCEP